VCLDELINLIPSLPGWTQWNEIEINADYDAYDDERIAVIGDVTVTVTLPQLVYDKPYVEFNDAGVSIKYGDFYRAPRDGARVLVYAQQTGQQYYYAYRADTGQWTAVYGYTVGDEVPVNQDMDLHLSAMLAERILPIYGLTATPELNAMIKRARNAWMQRYSNRFEPRSVQTAESDLSQWM
jgi:hypothetical protein